MFVIMNNNFSINNFMGSFINVFIIKCRFTFGNIMNPCSHIFSIGLKMMIYVRRINFSHFIQTR